MYFWFLNYNTVQNYILKWASNCNLISAEHLINNSTSYKESRLSKRNHMYPFPKNILIKYKLFMVNIKWKLTIYMKIHFPFLELLKIKWKKFNNICHIYSPEWINKLPTFTWISQEIRTATSILKIHNILPFIELRCENKLKN